MDRELRDIVKRVRTDTTSGASEIALFASESVGRFTRGPRAELRGIREFAIALVDAQPNMAPIWNLANSILLSELDGPSLAEICKRTSEHHRTAAKRVGANAALALRDCVLVTNSSSKAIYEAVLAASRRTRISVLLPESGPKREGLDMAKQLARSGVDVTLFGDSSLSRAVSKADIALVGVDAVTRSSVIGKVGILNLVLSSREYSIECLACGDSSKFAPIGLVEDSRPAREIASRLPSRVRVENVYFEEAPIARFSWIVTESGRLKPSQAARIVSDIKVAKELVGRKS